ncbi:MAG: branched-chain amino acid ABC transporter permease, partial [Leifsonia sp.]
MDWIQIFSNASQELISPTTAAYALAALGLAIHFGYTGLLNFGQAGFMALGAYGYAISTLTFGFPVWAAVLVGIGSSVVFALILGIPTLRLRADYLAIVTIAAAEILRLLFTTGTWEAVTGSASGLQGYKGGFADLNPIPPGIYGIGPFTYNAYDWWIRIVGWTLVIVFGLLTALIIRSPWGRVIKGIREDEDAVRALGKNVYSYKMQSLILGGVYGTIGGMIFVLPRAV